MLRLECLGRLAVLTGGIPAIGAAAQRRRLALLAVLAIAGDRGMARDRVLALFWPESDDDSARSALKQAVYALRRDLGEDVITGVTELRLNPAAISVDVWDFERAIAEKHFDDAVAVYGGRFFESVHAGDSVEIDQWADGERNRLESRFCQALEITARDAAKAGDAPRCAETWKRLAERQPLDSRIAVDTARAMAAAGDRAGALNHLRSHEARVREELGIDADPGVAGAIAELRLARTSGPTTPMPVASFDRMPESDPVSLDSAATKIRGPWRRAGAIAAATALVVLGISAAYQRLAVPETPALGRRIAVLPFRYHGDTAYAYLGDGMVALLSGMIDGVGGLHSVTPPAVFAAVAGADHGAGPAAMAQRLNAAVIVEGEILEVGGHLRIAATLTERDGARKTLTASAEGAPDQFLHLVDQVAADLLANLGESAAPGLARTAAATSTSFTALRAYLLGESLMREGRYGEAIEAFQQAVRADSLFAIAWYRLNVASDWASGINYGAESERVRLTTLSARLPEYERLIVEAHVLWRSAKADSAEALLRRVVLHYPEDAVAWYLLGEVLFHNNGRRGRLLEEARAPFEHVIAIDPYNHEAMLHLARIAARDGRQADALGFLDRAIARHPANLMGELTAFRAFVAADTSAERAAIASLRTNPAEVFNVAWRVAVFARDWVGAQRIMETSSAAANPEPARRWAFFLRANLAVGRGRWHEGLALLDSLGPDTVISTGTRALFLSMPFAPDLATERRTARDQVAGGRLEGGAVLPSFASQPALFHIMRPYLMGLLDLRGGDASAAERQAQVIDRMSVSSYTVPYRAAFADDLRSMIAWRAGRPRDILPSGRQLNDLWHENQKDEPFDLSLLERLMHGIKLAQLHRDDEALGFLGSIDQETINGVPYLAAALRATADIHRRHGDRAAEADALQLLVRLWKDCDPELRPALDSARTRLSELAGR